MIVNPNKFKSIVVKRNQVPNHPTHFMAGNNKGDTKSSVKLLGISIDNEPSFD